MGNSKRVINELKNITSDLNSYDKNKSFYYNYDESDIHKGIFLLMGVKDTPYFGGFYFFENVFHENFPFDPPKIKFLSNDGITLYNPNLYINGKVCLSIINTWGESTWTPIMSFSNVLEAIRTHLFNENPLFNEPGCCHNDKSQGIIYNRIIMYQNLNFNIYHNILQTPSYAEPFKKIMCLNFLENEKYFKSYITLNKTKYDGKIEKIYFLPNYEIKYDFEILEKKLDQIIDESKKYLNIGI